MLDTNAASHIVKGASPQARKRLTAIPITDLCISAITEGELRFGLATRPAAVELARAVGEFLRRVDSLTWDSAAAQHYGRLRAAMQAVGTPLGNLDTLIAAHALAADAILVTSDAAFARVPNLAVVDWTVD